MNGDLINLSAAITIIREQGVYGEGHSPDERENDVINMLESLPPADLSCLWHDAITDPPKNPGWYQAFCEGHTHPEYLYFRGRVWAANSQYHKIIYWADAMPLPKGGI